MRGIAAIQVTWFHLFLFTPVVGLSDVLPAWLSAIFAHGDLGVPVFFVISGFVIALAILDHRITGRFVGEFAIRRSIRLDLPYWATIAIAVPLLVVAGRAPTVGNVLAHIFYLQKILDYRDIVSVFWSLTYEVQFYLVLVVLAGLAQRSGPAWRAAIAVVPFVVSLWFLATGNTSHGFFIDRWYLFCLGVITLGLVRGRVSNAAWGAVIVVVGAIALARRELPPITACVTAIVIAGLAKRDKLASWSGGSVLQWLGRISYSLYLTHFLATAVAKVVGPRVSGPLGLGALFIASIAVALIVAQVFFLVVERPAHTLSRRVGQMLRAR
jgi:peptidoglycan/LPS O-acetylase OafA/YrhL